MWWRWTLGCAFGESLGLLASALLGALVSRLAPEDGSIPWLLAPLLPLVGAVEGAFVGAGQAFALGALVDRRRWIGATAAAFALAWLGGALFSFLEPPRPSSTGLLLLAAAIAGALVGLLAALAQARRAGLPRLPWVAASATGWGAGLVLAALLSQRIWGPFGAAVLLQEAVKGLAVGLVVGLVTGPTLRRLLLSAAREGEESSA